MEDTKIIELFFERSEQAIQELDIKYGKICHKLSYNIVNNRQDAEECVNDAYFGVWNAIPPAKPDPLLAYLCKIVRNLSLKAYFRKDAAKRSSAYTIAMEEIETCIAHPATVEVEIEASELARILEQFLDTLSAENRTIFMRRYWFFDNYKDIAACLVIAICTSVILLPQKAPEVASDLPMLSISEHTNEGMGFEGYMAYESSELINANPWNETLKISTLPVYQNPLIYDTSDITAEANFDKMREFLLEVAGKFGLDTETLTITDHVQTIHPQVITQADGLKIEVDETMTATISFEPAVPLPDPYNVSDYAPYEDMAAAEYLKQKYKTVIGFDNPQVNICGGDYTYDAQQAYSIEFFNADGTASQQIIHYNFNRVAFYCNEEGDLSLARIYQPDLSKKAGDYPIITSKQAKKMLSNGKYLTTAPYEMPGLEYVKKTELVYRTGKQETYYMPYYCFYVELPEERQENGLKTYGAYYVPAVDEAYISNMPAGDNNFN